MDHAVVLAPFLALTAAFFMLYAYQWRQIGDDVLERSQQNVVDQTTAFAGVVGNTVALVDALLKSIRYVYETAGTEAVESFLASEHLSNTAIVYFAVAATDGTSFIFNDPGHNTVNLSDRSHFRAQQGATEDRLFVGLPNVGRLSNKVVIPLTRGLHQPGNVLGGIVMAGIAPSLLSSRLYDPAKLGMHGIISVVGLDGVIRVHSSPFADGLGTKISDQSPLWEQLKRAPKGTFWQQSSVDGMLRLYAYERVEGVPLVVVSGISKDEMREQIRARRLPLLWGYGVVLCLLCVVLALVLRQRMIDFNVSRDRARLAEALAEIEQHVYRDTLTGLPNRLLLQDRLALAIENAQRRGRRLALLFVDLDGFKTINDSFGHDVGDAVLQDVAARLSTCLRHSDTVARLGGDEFIVILPDIEIPDEAAEVAQKIIERLTWMVSHDRRKIRMGASVGVALFPDDGRDVTRLMKVADIAMYQAKACGRNAVRFFDQKTMEAMIERLSLVEHLRHAAAAGEYELHYQPKVSLASGQIEGAEALIRWNSRELGLVPPDRFIPLAEECGLINDIGTWVMEEACRQLAEWDAAGLAPICVAVNVSVIQLHDDRFVTDVARLMEKYRLAPSRLEIELTESAVMAEPERVASQLHRLRDTGVRIAVDDFGTGHSSLGHLKRLSFNVIKIDKTFVRGVERYPDSAAIIAAILGLARALDLSVVAEGIGTKAEEKHLRDAGCTMGQGFLYARPLPPEEFVAWLAERRQDEGADLEMAPSTE